MPQYSVRRTLYCPWAGLRYSKVTLKLMLQLYLLFARGATSLDFSFCVCLSRCVVWRMSYVVCRTAPSSLDLIIITPLTLFPYLWLSLWKQIYCTVWSLSGCVCKIKLRRVSLFLSYMYHPTHHRLLFLQGEEKQINWDGKICHFLRTFLFGLFTLFYLVWRVYTVCFARNGKTTGPRGI